MNKILNILEQNKVIPVVVLKEIEDTVPALKALRDGGLPVAEITFRTKCAMDAIKVGLKEFPEMLIGAGTVINSNQCLQAVGCGAKFIVSPGFSRSVAEVCKDKNVPYFPGCVTPTEIMEAIDCGITTVKYFPAQNFGGLKAIKALSASFPGIKFIPTGGIDNSNLAEYIACDKIFACGGSWVLKGGYEENLQAVKTAVNIVSGGKI